MGFETVAERQIAERASGRSYSQASLDRVLGQRPGDDLYVTVDRWMSQNGVSRNGIRSTVDIGTNPLPQEAAMDIRRALGSRNPSTIEAERGAARLVEEHQAGLRRGHEALVRQAQGRADEVARLMAVADPTPEQLSQAMKLLEQNKAESVATRAWMNGDDVASGGRRLANAEDWVAANLQKMQRRYEDLVTLSVRSPSPAVEAELKALKSTLRGNLDTRAGSRVFQSVSEEVATAQEAQRAAREAAFRQEESARRAAQRQMDDLEAVSRRIQRDQADDAAAQAAKALQQSERAKLSELAGGIASRRSASIADAAEAVLEAQRNLQLAQQSGKYLREAQEAALMAKKYQDAVKALDAAERQLSAARQVGQLGVADDLAREVARLSSAEQKISGEIFRTSEYWKKPLREAAAQLDNTVAKAAVSNVDDAERAVSSAAAGKPASWRDRMKKFFGRGGTSTDLKAAESALAACGVSGPGRGLLAFCSLEERRFLSGVVARLRARVAASASTFGASVSARSAALAERLGVGAGSKAAHLASEVGRGLGVAKRAATDGLRAAAPTLKTLGKAAAWIQAGHALAENVKLQAKFNDEIKEKGVVDDDKLTDLAYGYTTDLLLGHGGTKGLVNATSKCFDNGAWGCTKKIGSGAASLVGTVASASGNCIIHPWECTKKIGGGLKSFAVGVGKWTKETGEAAGDRVFKWVDEAERKKSCGRSHNRFDKMALGATGGLYGSQGRFTTAQECTKADKEEANWKKAWKSFAMEKAEKIDSSKYNPLNWFKSDKKRRTTAPPAEAAVPAATTEAPKPSTLSKLNPLNWFGKKTDSTAAASVEPKKEKSFWKPSTWW